MTTKEMSDRLATLKISKKYVEEQVHQLEKNFSDQADISVVLFEAIKDIEKSIYLLQTKAAVVSINVYKDFQARLLVCKRDFENVTINLDNIKKMLTYHREQCKLFSFQIEEIEKELAQYGKICKLNDNT